MFEQLGFAELKDYLKNAQKEKKKWQELQIVSEIAERYIREGDYGPATKFIQDAIDLANNLNYTLGIIELCEQQVILQREIGEAKKARKLNEKILEMHKKLGNRQGEADTLLIAAFLDIDLGDYDPAIEKSNMAMFIYEELGNLVGKAECLNCLGDAFYQKGDKEEALIWWDNGIKNAEIENDHSVKTKALVNKGVMYFKEGEYKTAFTHFNDALSIDSEHEYTTKQAIDLNNIGLIYKIMDQNSAAHQALNNALNLLDHPSVANFSSIVTENLTEISKKKFKEKSIKKLSVLPHPRKISRRIEHEMEDILDLGDAYFEKDNFESALEKYQEAVKMGTPLGNAEIRAKAIKKMAIVHKESGRHKHALQWFNEARKIKSNISEKLDILGHIGDVFYNLRDTESALGWYNKRFKVAQQLGDNVEQGSSLIMISRIMIEQGEAMKATKYLLTALEQYKSIGHVQGQIDSLNSLATSYEKLGDRKSAMKYKLERDKLTKNQI